MGYGEPELVDRLNTHFEDNDITALAYRQPQVMRRTQHCDITIDSSEPNWYMAVEVKSRTGRRALSFDGDFQTEDEKKGHQLFRLCEFAKATGRIPIVYYICRKAHKNRYNNEYYSLDAYKLLEHMEAGNCSVRYNDLSDWNLGWFDTKPKGDV